MSRLVTPVLTPGAADADPSELIVGLFDSERSGGMEWTTDAFNAHIAQFFKAHGADCSLELPGPH